MQAIGRGRGSERIQLIKADIAEVSQLQLELLVWHLKLHATDTPAQEPELHSSLTCAHKNLRAYTKKQTTVLQELEPHQQEPYSIAT